MTKSPAYVLIAHIWRHSSHHGGPWNRLNTSMQKAVSLAISAGLTFGKGDFVKIRKDCRGHRWFGADNGEWFYCQTIAANNTSAAQAYEHYRGRGPFIADGVTPYMYGSDAAERQRERLAFGFSFTWQGKYVTVTSFAEDGSYLMACSYQETGPHGWTKKLDKRFKITAADIQADRKERKAK